MEYITPNKSGLDLTLRGDRKATSVAESLGGNLEPGSCLLTLVFGAIHQSNHASHYFNVDATVRGDALGRMRIFHIVLEYGIENVIRRQRVAVFLIGAQLGRRRLFQRGSRNHF